MIRRFGLLLAVTSIIGMAACGGGGGGNGGSTVTSVMVSCSPSTVTSGASSQCTATVNGTGNFSTGVTWTTSAGSISPTGLLTAPKVTTNLLVTVTATSTQNTNVAGTATVSVNPASAGSNVAPITVDAGPANLGYVSTNVAFVTVTVCVPGTTNCQNIDHVMVDTGSFGLRLMSSASGGEVSSSLLPQENDSNGNPLDECLVFLDGYIWGPVQTADVTVAGESASNVPIQLIIPSSSSPSVPQSCSSQNPSGGAGNEGNSLGAFGANGILGVGVFPQDCGAACTSQNSSPPDQYYACPSSGCSPSFVTIAQQVPNPVSLFTSTGDDNGVQIQLPSVPDGGSGTVNGSLIFGIGTQSNNGLGGVQVYSLNNQANFTTTFNGSSYPGFVDSGSNGFFFQDSSISTCPSPNQEWYCPSTSPDNLSAGNQGTNMNSPVTSNFSIENADNLFNGSNSAFSTLGGTYPGTPVGFDWGLAFFYGRNVFTAIDGVATPVGNGPYYAF